MLGLFLSFVFVEAMMPGSQLPQAIENIPKKADGQPDYKTIDEHLKATIKRYGADYQGFAEVVDQQAVSDILDRLAEHGISGLTEDDAKQIGNALALTYALDEYTTAMACARENASAWRKSEAENN